MLETPPQRLLQGLDDIDWPSLDHCYGSASDIPDLLCELADPEPGIHHEALNDLYSRICHQGTLYEASAHAVPFLLELLQADIAIGKVEILAFLVHLATGSTYHGVHGDFFYRHLDPGLESEHRADRSWAAATHEAVRAGAPVYERLASASDALTRAAAADLLGIAPQSPVRSLRILADLFHSAKDSEAVSLAAVLAAGRLGKDLPDARAFVADICAGPYPRLIRVAAALGSWTPGGEIPESAKEILREVLADPGDLQKRFEILPWTDFDVRELAGQTLDMDPDELEVLLRRPVPTSTNASRAANAAPAKKWWRFW